MQKKIVDTEQEPLGDSIVDGLERLSQATTRIDERVIHVASSLMQLPPNSVPQKDPAILAEGFLPLLPYIELHVNDSVNRLNCVVDILDFIIKELPKR